MISNHILVFVSRIVLFNAPLWYTHVFSPSSTESAVSEVSTKDEKPFSLQMSRVRVGREKYTRADNAGASDLLREFNGPAAKDNLSGYTDDTTSGNDSRTISDACSLTELEVASTAEYSPSGS